MTSLPSDTTLLTLPPGPLLQLVCAAIQRNVNAVWLALASMLIRQLDPPSLLSLKSKASAEAEALVSQLLPMLLEATLTFLGRDGVMQDVS